jgi:thiol-disulfide isomerase/thioredoxin
MEGVIQLGPIAFSIDRLAAVAAIWLFLAVGSWLSAEHEGTAAAASWVAAAIGLAVARVAYVLENLASFRLAPLEALYFWQGGFSPWFGIAAAGLVIVRSLRARPRWMALGTLLVLATLWSLLTTVTANTTVRTMPSVVGITNLRGMAVDLQPREGPYVINLWATWCPPCRREMPMLEKAASTNSEVPILLINQGETSSDVREFLVEQGLADDHVLLDQKAVVSASLGASAFPTTIFIDATGKLQNIHHGEISRAALATGIRALKRNRGGQDPPRGQAGS